MRSSCWQTRETNLQSLRTPPKSSTMENDVDFELYHHDFPCLKAQGQNSPARSRMDTVATEADFELVGPCQLTDSERSKVRIHEPVELEGSDGQSSTDEGSIVPQACGTEVSEDASDLAECFDCIAAPGLAANATSYSRSFLLGANVKLGRQTQQPSP